MVLRRAARGQPVERVGGRLRQSADHNQSCRPPPPFRPLVDCRQAQCGDVVENGRTLIMKSGLARKLIASAPEALAASRAGKTASRVATLTTFASTPRLDAASTNFSTCRGLVRVESRKVAIRRAPGTASISRSWRLPSRSGDA